MPFFDVGEVRVADDEDLTHFKNICDDDTDWKVDYSKNDVSVLSQETKHTNFKIMKVRATMKMNADTVYDVLHDPVYRKVWDKSMIEGYEICCLSPNTDIGYYALRSMIPFKNRDFVTLRCWLATPKEYIIFNHSVFHKALPPKKNFVRAVSHLTGYLLRPLSANSCRFTYVAQCDPRGSLPAWAVNKASQFVAPKITQRLARACVKYESWKKKNNPGWKPWIYPEQMELERLNPDDILSQADFEINNLVDETGLKETKDSENMYDEDTVPFNGGGGAKNGSESGSLKGSPCVASKKPH